MNRKIVILIITIFIGVIVTTITYDFFADLPTKRTDIKPVKVITEPFKKNVQYKHRTCEEVIKLIRESNVVNVKYDPMSLQAISFNVLTVTLKDGSSFEAGPIRCILSEVEKCCKDDIKIERVCGQNCI